ncbi:hypothetical protein Nepgr_023091 [Nepenthes gracilis]|uniref:Uncharacterized protein n=1 Tax=Nepenthes gracilis TaxID=150966 RepID=A0AAD3T236_NEPGR|nr:hypothetical protein Nepgr_023091 [Nepenthes gracilis]
MVSLLRLPPPLLPTPSSLDSFFFFFHSTHLQPTHLPFASPSPPSLLSDFAHSTFQTELPEADVFVGVHQDALGASIQGSGNLDPEGFGSGPICVGKPPLGCLPDSPGPSVVGDLGAGAAPLATPSPPQQCFPCPSSALLAESNASAFLHAPSRALQFCPGSKSDAPVIPRNSPAAVPPPGADACNHGVTWSSVVQQNTPGDLDSGSIRWDDVSKITGSPGCIERLFMSFVLLRFAFPTIPACWMRSDAGGGAVEVLLLPIASCYWKTWDAVRLLTALIAVSALCMANIDEERHRVGDEAHHISSSVSAADGDPGPVICLIQSPSSSGPEPISSKSGPPALGSSVQTCPPDRSSAELESCKVNDSLSPSGPPRIPEPPGETCSENNLATPNLKDVNGCLSSVTGFKSPGYPAVLYRAMSSETPQLGAECTPNSVILVDPGLDLHLTADSPRSESDNSVILVDAALPAVGIPRTVSCPAMMQLYFQQTGLIPVLAVGSNSPKSRLPIGPSYAEILCCGIGADPTGSVVGGEAYWPISEEDRIAALRLVVAPLAPVLEPASGLVSYPPGPLDPAVDLTKTPPSISCILTKYSLDTSFHLGHGSSSPKSLSVASSTDSHLDNSEVSYLGPQANPPQLDFWQPVQSRRMRKSASKNSKGF